MKTIKLLVFTLLLPIASFAQNKYNKPVFQSCGNTPVEQLDACFEEKMQAYISENLIYPGIAKEDSLQGFVDVSIIIDEYGKVISVKSNKKADILFKAEVARLMYELPVFAYFNDADPDRFVYETRISFNLAKEWAKDKEKARLDSIAMQNKLDKKVTDQDSIPESLKNERRPIFPGCENEPEDSLGYCFQIGLQKHLARVFQYPEIAKHYWIQGKVFVQFTLDTVGSVVDIKVVKGAHGLLDNAALKMVQSIPKMTPAFQNGKPVKMLFTVPIVFRLQ